MSLFTEEILIEGCNVLGKSLYPSESEEEMSGDMCEALYSGMAVIPVQTHSVNVAVVKDREEVFSDVDALITFIPGLPVGVRTADCVPILIYSPDAKGVAAVHAGWKGTLGGIVGNVVDVLCSHGASPSNMRVAFGPSISHEAYEVDTDLARRFADAGFSEYISYPSGPAGKPHLDLQGVNINRLIRCGVKPGNILPHNGCTFRSLNNCGRPLYQSHRRSHGAPGRNLTFITLSPD